MRPNPILCLLAAVLLALPACREISPEDGNGIVFRVENEGTKATVIENTAKLATEYGSVGFGVLAYQFGDAWSSTHKPNFMYNEKVTRISDTWQTNSVYLWPGGNYNLRFFAYAPYNVSGLTLPASSSTGVPVLSFTVPTDLSAQKELLVADTGTITGRYKDAIELDFYHPLSLVRFKLSADSSSGTVNSITLNNLYGSGSLRAEPAYWRPSVNPWDLGGVSASASYTASLGLAHTWNDEGNDTNLYNASGNGLFLLIPQTLDPSATLSVSFTPASSSTPEVLTGSIAGNTFSWGHCTTITLHIEYNLYLKLEVEDWDDGGTYAHTTSVETDMSIPLPGTYRRYDVDGNFETWGDSYAAVAFGNDGGGIPQYSSQLDLSCSSSNEALELVFDNAAFQLVKLTAGVPESPAASLTIPAGQDVETQFYVVPASADTPAFTYGNLYLRGVTSGRYFPFNASVLPGNANSTSCQFCVVTPLYYSGEDSHIQTER